MSRQKLEQALKNWRDKLAEYEYERSVTASIEKKFELKQRIQECETEIQKIQKRLEKKELLPKFKTKSLKKERKTNIIRTPNQSIPEIVTRIRNNIKNWRFPLKKILLGLAFLTILGCIELAFTLRPKPDVFEKYEFSLNYPDIWERREIIENGRDNSNIFLGVTEVLQLIPSNNDRSFEVSVSVKIEEFLEPTTLDEYYQDVIAKIRKYGTYRLDGEEKTTLGGQPAYKIFYSGNNGEQNLKIMAVFALKEEGDTRIYRIIYKAEADQDNNFFAEAESMIRSFKFN